MELETDFCREAIKIQSDKVLKENPVADRTWMPARLFVLKNNTVIANMDVPLTI